MIAKESVTIMESNKLLELFKQYGLNSVLIVLLVFFMTNFNSQLEEIKKDLVNIKITLTEIQARYIDKDNVRQMIDQAIQKHEQKYHQNNK